MSDNRNSRNGNRGKGSNPSQKNDKQNSFKKKEFKKHEENNTKEINYYMKDPKEKKEFNIELGWKDTEKVDVPVYNYQANDECVLILVKEFNILIEDGDILKEETIGEEVSRAIWKTATKTKNKLIAIKEVYRKFRSCLKEKPRDTWL